jgi:hypothetical protein
MPSAMGPRVEIGQQKAWQWLREQGVHVDRIVMLHDNDRSVKFDNKSIIVLINFYYGEAVECVWFGDPDVAMLFKLTFC